MFITHTDITEVMQRKKKNRFSSCHKRMIAYNLGQEDGPRHEWKWQREKSKMLFKTQTKGNHVCLLKRKHNSYLWRGQALNFSFPFLETDEGRRRERQMFQSLSQTFHTYRRWWESPLCLAPMNGEELQKWRKPGGPFQILKRETK